MYAREYAEKLRVLTEKVRLAIEEDNERAAYRKKAKRVGPPPEVHISPQIDKAVWGHDVEEAMLADQQRILCGRTSLEEHAAEELEENMGLNPDLLEDPNRGPRELQDIFEWRWFPTHPPTRIRGYRWGRWRASIRQRR